MVIGFDKEKYWERRKQGKRGQGDYPVLTKVIQEGTQFNRQLRRRKK